MSRPSQSHWFDPDWFRAIYRAEKQDLLSVRFPVAAPLGASAVDSAEPSIQSSRPYAGWGRSKSELLRRIAVLQHPSSTAPVSSAAASQPDYTCS